MKMSNNLGLGEGIPVATIGAQDWQSESKFQGWRQLTDDDRYEFEHAPAAPYLVREHHNSDIFVEERGSSLRGARRLVVVFRSGHQMRCGDSPGWHSLSRAICDAEDALERCPALGADAEGVRNIPSAKWFVSALISDFVYVAAPGGMALSLWGARICDDFEAGRMDAVSRHTAGLYQRLVDKRRRFDRGRMTNYPAILHFPSALLAAKRLRRRRAA